MWLKGQTTWANFVTKMTALAAGEVADDIGNTVAVGDRWIREFVGEDLLASPLHVPTVGVYRCGYLNKASSGLYGNSLSNYAGKPAEGQFIRQTAICAALPAARVGVVMHIQGVNTVAGNYSNATIRIGWFNLDTGAWMGSADYVPNAAGDVNVFGGTFRVGNPATGILVNDNVNGPANFTRWYTAAFPGGVDWWPTFHKKRPGVAPTFPTALPGAQGVDWDFASFGVDASISGNLGFIDQYPFNGKGSGIGIKTNAALTGALYSMSVDCSEMKVRMRQNGSGVVALDFHGTLAPDGGGTYRRLNGVGISQWLAMFQTAGSVLAGSVIQYWMSVTAKKIMIVANGDPGQTGRLGTACVFKFDALDATHDLFPWIVSPNSDQYLTDNTGDDNANMIPAVRLYDEYVAVADPAITKDWEKGWCYPTLAYASATSGSDVNSAQTGYQFDGRLVHPWGGVGYATRDGYFPNFESKPHPITGKWHMYGWLWGDYRPSYDGDGATAPNDALIRRGTTTDDFLFVPSTGWSSGDEVTDTASGRTWFLAQPDYMGFGYRRRYAGNSYGGGVAILEE